MSLAPLLVLMIWGTFMFVKDMMVKLVSLLGCSLTLPMVFMDLHKAFWPCGLLLILMSTGLIVVFAYVVSLHSGSSIFSIKYSFIVIAAVVLVWLNFDFSLWPFKSLDLMIKVEYMLSLVLIYVLLFLVINFVRLVYSKGGGFRKKF